MRANLARRALLGAATLLVSRASFAADRNATIDNFAFTPAVLMIPAGTKVTWTNRDDIPHTVTSASRPPVFRSPPLDTGDGFSWTFDTPGTFGYFCALHPHMRGTVVVT